MNYCPYCGAALMGGAALFCPHCGKRVPSALKPGRSGQKKQQRPAPGSEYNADTCPTPRGKNRAQPTQPKVKPGRNGKKSPSSHKKKKFPEPERVPKPDLRDIGYDGYYDDVQPIDDGHVLERVDPHLIRRVVLITAGAFVIVVLSLVLIYVL